MGVDEIYYKVDHLEPWATGSRKTAGRSQTGMCGGVRGVSAGGIVSSAYCLLFKLYTLKLTKKQVMGLLNHCDSPYIRGLGFMYLRYTLPAANMWDWFEPYLEDEEEIDIKAGGGKPMSMGELCKTLLTRLEWFDTRFPRIAVNYEKIIRDQLDARAKDMAQYKGNRPDSQQQQQFGGEEKQKTEVREIEKKSRSKSRDTKSKDRKSRDRSRSRDKKKKDRSRDRSRSRDRKKDRSRSRDKHHKKQYKRSRTRSRDRGDKKYKERDNRDRDSDYSYELKKYKDSRKHGSSRRSRSRS